MNELKKSVMEMWGGLTGPRRLSLIATAVFSVVVMVSVVIYSSKPKLSLLYSKLEPSEAAKVVDFLQGRNVKFELKDGGGTIMVPAQDVYEVRLELAAEGIPRTADTAGGVGFEIFDSTRFGMSDFMQKANYRRALQGELARTIQEMDEIDQARVMIVVPEKRLFSKKGQQSKASVFLKVQSGRTLEEGKIQAIRFLVANGVEGLEANRVAIVDSAGRGLALNRMNGSLESLTSQQLNYRAQLEEHLQFKAQSMLDQVLGPGEAVVQVAAEVNFDHVQETSEKFDPNVAVVRKEHTDTESVSSKTQTSSGAAGTASNVEDDQGGAGGTSSQTQKENATNEYEINRIIERRQRAAGSIQQLSVAVFVNAKQGAGGGAVTPRTPQEIKGLEDIVKNAVGFMQAGGRKDTIEVQEIEFVDLFANQEEESGGVAIMKEADKYMPYVSQGFLILLAVAVMLYFRSVVKSASNADSEENSEFAEILSRFEDLEQKEKDDEVKLMQDERAASILNVEQMSRIIRDNPTNTSQAIRQWLTKN